MTCEYCKSRIATKTINFKATDEMLHVKICESCLYLLRATVEINGVEEIKSS